MDKDKENQIQAMIDDVEFITTPSKVEKKEDKPDAHEIIRDLHNTAIIAQVQNDEETKQKFLDQAKDSVENELETLKQENINSRQQATYNANEEACKNYGVDKSVPLWQIRLMKFGSGLWFIVYWIFATVTICPVSVFFKGIKTFIKQTWLVFVLALLAYLLIVVGIPLIIALLKKYGINIGGQ